MRGVSYIGVWFLINLFIEHTDAGATLVSSVGVPFDEEAMRGIAEVPSLDVELLCVSHLVLESI